MRFKKNITFQVISESTISFTFSDDEAYMGNKTYGYPYIVHNQTNVLY